MRGGGSVRRGEVRGAPVAMSSFEGKTRVSLGAASVAIPEALLPAGQSLDSPSNFFEGLGMSVLIDQGPFSDDLTSAVGHAEYRETTEQVAGVPAKVVSYRDPGGTGYIVAAHIPGLNRLTVVVRASDSVPRQVADEVIDSIEAAESNKREE